MNTLILVFFTIIAVVIATGVFAQTDKKTDDLPTLTEKKLATHCYSMKDGAMMHCMSVNAEPMTDDVTLNNGTIISTMGEVTTKDGKKSRLEHGQCIDLAGTIGDFASMHPEMKIEEKKH